LTVVIHARNCTMNQTVSELDIDRPLFTYKTLAEWTGYSIRHLQGEVEKGRLKKRFEHTATRFTATDVIAWLEKGAATTAVVAGK
jgi:hypothetical protein